MLDQWSIWDLHADTGNHVATAVVDNEYYRLNDIGVLYQQQPNFYYDKVSGVAKAYDFALTTGWINVGQLQQLGRVYRLLVLGDFNSFSKPKIVLYTDYKSSSDASIEYPAAGSGLLSQFQLELKLPKQKVKAFKFSVADDKPGAGGGSMAIQSYALLIGVKRDETSFKFPTADHISSVI